MKPEQLSKYMEKQRKKIDEDKWKEGERIQRDPGQDFVLKWIKEKAPKFRKDYTKEELDAAQKEIDEMNCDLANNIVNINKLKKYLEDIQNRIDVAKETLEAKEEE